MRPVAVSNRQRRVRVSTPRLRATAEAALRALGRADLHVDVAVVDDPVIRRLNARYLRRRKTTDVLAFDLEAPGPSRLMGEVIVCADTARRQARRVGVSVALELDEREPLDVAEDVSHREETGAATTLGQVDLRDVTRHDDL